MWPEIKLSEWGEQKGEDKMGCCSTEEQRRRLEGRPFLLLLLFYCRTHANDAWLASLFNIDSVLSLSSNPIAICRIRPTNSYPRSRRRPSLCTVFRTMKGLINGSKLFFVPSQWAISFDNSKATDDESRTTPVSSCCCHGRSELFMAMTKSSDLWEQCNKYPWTHAL